MPASELEIIKQAKEAILMCIPSIDERSPAHREVKKALDMITEYLSGKQK